MIRSLPAFGTTINSIAIMKKTKNTTPIQAVGIDVSKADLHIALDRNQGLEPILRIKNSEEAIKTFMKTHLGNYEGKIILESTGDFHILAAVLMSEAGLDVRVINPLMSAKYAQSNIRKVKTDKADARLLAKIAIVESDLPHTFACSRQEVNYRKKMKLLDTLSDQITRLQLALKNYQSTLAQLGLPLSQGEAGLHETIKLLKIQKKQLLQELGPNAPTTNPEEAEMRKRLQEVPGVSAHTAAAVTMLMAEGPATTAKQWIAYTGLDISIKESGQWKGRCKISKRGNSVLRRWIYGAAWGAAINNDQFRSYYEHLKNKGRHHFECLMIIARKLLRIMFNLVKNKTKFNPAIPLIPAAA